MRPLTLRPLPVALITGASRGIGAATARRFAAEGFDLLLVARGLADLEGLATELRAQGRLVETLALDLTQAEAIAPAMAELLGRGPVPSVVINNAGAAWTGPLAAMPI